MKRPMVCDWTSYFSFRCKGPKASPALPDSASSDLHMLLHVEADVLSPAHPILPQTVTSNSFARIAVRPAILGGDPQRWEFRPFIFVARQKYHYSA